MARSDFAKLVRKYAWAIAFVVVIVAGYSVGKDAAMRDNAADRAVMVEGKS